MVEGNLSVPSVSFSVQSTNSGDGSSTITVSGNTVTSTNNISPPLVNSSSQSTISSTTSSSSLSSVSSSSSSSHPPALHAPTLSSNVKKQPFKSTFISCKLPFPESTDSRLSHRRSVAISIIKEHLNGLLEPINNNEVKWTFNPFRLAIVPHVGFFRFIFHFDDAITNAAFLERAKAIIREKGNGNGNWFINNDGSGGQFYNGYISKPKLSIRSSVFEELQTILQTISKNNPDAKLTIKSTVIPFRENLISYSGIPINIRRDHLHLLYDIPDTILHDRTKSMSDINVCWRCHRIKDPNDDHSNCLPACRHCLGPYSNDPPSSSDSKSSPTRSSTNHTSSICSKRGCIKREDPSLSCPRCVNTNGSSPHDAEDCPRISFSKIHVRPPPSSSCAPSTSSIPGSKSTQPFRGWKDIKQGSNKDRADSYGESFPSLPHAQQGANMNGTSNEVTISEQSAVTIATIIAAALKPVVEQLDRTNVKVASLLDQYNTLSSSIASLQNAVQRIKSKSRSPPHRQVSSQRKRVLEESDRYDETDQSDATHSDHWGSNTKENLTVSGASQSSSSLDGRRSSKSQSQSSLKPTPSVNQPKVSNNSSLSSRQSLASTPNSKKHRGSLLTPSKRSPLPQAVINALLSDDNDNDTSTRK
jgi:hypothetical protein